MIGAQHKGVRGNAELAQHHHGVLGGLGLELVGGGNVRHQGNVHEHAVVRAEIAAHFAGGLKEGLGLDVADGTTDFGDDHIRGILGARHSKDISLDSLVMCGMTCTHWPRYSPARSLRSTS